MQYRFAAFDLDGTLLNDKKELTPKTRAALAQLQARGVRLILASARHPKGVLPLAQELDFPAQSGVILCFNGGCAVDCRTGNALVRYCMDGSVAVSVIRACRAFGLQPLTYTDTTLLCEDAQNEYVQLEARLNHLPVVEVRDLSQSLPAHVDKLLLVAPPETVRAALEPLQKQFAGVCDIYCSAPYFIEVMTTGVNKASALRALLENFGAGPDNLVSFGDGQNDIPMLDLAAIGVVMENASPDVKEHGQMITRSCNDDGVAAAIEEIWQLPSEEET